MAHTKRPHSLNWFLAPWGQRADQYRVQPVGFQSDVLPTVSGYVPGTAAYEAGGSTGPTAYDWDGQGAVPEELYEFLTYIGAMIGAAIPPKTEPADVAAIAGQIWQFFTAKGVGEGCGLNAETVQATLRNNAAAGPRAVAYAIQELMDSTQCARFIRTRLDPPADPVRPLPPVFVPPAPAPAPANGTRLPVPANGAKPFPWGWVLGGSLVLLAVGGGIYLATRKPKRSNPCACPNPAEPDAIETEGFEVFENPYGAAGPLGGPDPQALALAHPFGSVRVLSNPRRKRPKAGRSGAA